MKARVKDGWWGFFGGKRVYGGGMKKRPLGEGDVLELSGEKAFSGRWMDKADSPEAKRGPGRPPKLKSEATAKVKVKPSAE